MKAGWLNPPRILPEVDGITLTAFNDAAWASHPPPSWSRGVSRNGGAAGRRATPSSGAPGAPRVTYHDGDLGHKACAPPLLPEFGRVATLFGAVGPVGEQGSRDWRSSWPCFAAL